jgi:GT2 family glycosyltransferase
MNKPKISIIIPTYNRKELLGKCLESISLQDYKNIEIIVIVDTDVDNTINFVRQNFPLVKIIKENHRKGVSHLKNLGIIQSKGKYVLFLDSDIEFTNKSSISIMCNILEKNPKVGTVGGEGIWNGKEIIAVGGRKQTWYHFGKAIYITKQDAKEKINIKECDHLPTCNCMTRKKLLEEIGGFDSNYFYMGEDREFGLQIKKKGFKNLICFEAGVNHKKSPQGRIKNVSYLSYKNIIRCAIKIEGLFGALAFIIISNFLLVSSPFFFIKKKLFSNQKREITFIQESKISFSSKLINFMLLWKAILWNLFNLYKTFKSKKINFLDETEDETNIEKYF